MPTVYQSQRLVAECLHTKFNKDRTFLVEPRQHLNHFWRYAVGAGADYQSDNAFGAQCLPVDTFQLCGIHPVGVGVRLEICKILHGGIFPCEETFPGLQLLTDSFHVEAIGGSEGGVVAVYAAAMPDGAVTVGASRSDVDRDFLYLHARKEALQVFGIVGVPLIHSPVQLWRIRSPITSAAIDSTIGTARIATQGS